MEADISHFAMPDGSRVLFHAPAGTRPTILFCSREYLHGDSTRMIATAFREQGFGVLIYQAPYEVEARLMDPEVQKTVPPDSIEFRVHSLTRALARLDPQPRILVGQSAGARIATLVADTCGIRALVLFGYPFKNPGHGDEPARYAHLAHLETPCLIVQGDRDPYGGAEIVGKYALSPAIRLLMVPGDHRVTMLDSDHARIFGAIDTLLKDAGFQ